MIVPLRFRIDILRDDLPILVFVTLCCGATLIDYRLGIWDGLLLFAGLVAFLYRLTLAQRKSSGMEQAAEIGELEEIPPMPRGRAVLTLSLSLVFLLLSAQLLVWSVIHIAETLGVSELIIGLTVIAVGTSLPELVVSVTSALKGQTDLAIGNIVGSNIFNILAVLSIPCVLAPTTVNPEVLWRDYMLMLTLTIVVVVFAYLKGKNQITRFKGTMLFLVWLGYLGTLYFTASSAS